MPSDIAVLSGSPKRLLKEFDRMGVQYKVVHAELNVWSFQTRAGESRLMKGMVSEKLPLFSKMICDDKWWNYLEFISQGLPTPKTVLLENNEDAYGFVQSVKQAVVKPRDGAHGYGVLLGISDNNALRTAIQESSNFSDRLVLQEQIDGKDLRILVINYQIISALERRPAQVVGDGIHSVRELIDIENTRGGRGKIGVDPLSKISVDAVHAYLQESQLNSVPKKSEAVRVVGPSNHSLGGTVHDAMHLLNPALLEQVTHISTKLKLPIAGIDCILTSGGHYFLELNANPGIGIHDDNFAGVASGCFTTYAKLLYDDNF